MTDWPERGKCQREECRGGAARAPWFSCPDPEGDCRVGPAADPEPLTFPPDWAKVKGRPEGRPLATARGESSSRFPHGRGFLRVAQAVVEQLPVLAWLDIVRVRIPRTIPAALAPRPKLPVFRRKSDDMLAHSEPPCTRNLDATSVTPAWKGRP